MSRLIKLEEISSIIKNQKSIISCFEIVTNSGYLKLGIWENRPNNYSKLKALRFLVIKFLYTLPS